jgi:hypothetical protein
VMIGGGAAIVSDWAKQAIVPLLIARLPSRWRRKWKAQP